MPRGQFSLAALQTLRAVAGPGASIVIPEVVVWEWAEHARSAHIALEEAIKQSRVDEVLIARPTIESAPSIGEMVERIESVLPLYIEIWRPEDDTWRAAVRAQILQIGAGEVKGNVKTGAADSVIAACVEFQAERADSAVVVLTSDKRLRKSISSDFDNVRAASGTGALLQALNTFVPDTDDLALRLTEQLPDYLNERFGDTGETLSFRDLGVTMELDGEIYGAPGENGLSALTITAVDIAEIYDIQVDDDVGGGERLAVAELRIFGTIVGDVLMFHEVVPGQSGVSREEVDFSSDFVDVTVAVRWNHNWRIETVVPTGVAVLVVPGLEEEDSEDVLQFRASPSS